jgi:dTDP-4-dehydrorhamnose reductase
MPKILVVGRRGQIATALQYAILPTGWSLVALGRQDLDVLNCDSLRAIIKVQTPDVIINTAAYTSVDNAELSEDIAYQVNGRAPGVLAAVARDSGILFLHISTDYIFGNSLGRAWKEDDVAAPINVYGRSKLAGEGAIHSVGGRSIVVRTSWIFSPWGSNFVRTLLRLAASQSEIAVVADQFGGPTAADDFAAALIHVAVSLNDSPKSEVRLYHLSGQPTVSWAEFAETIIAGATWLRHSPSIKRIRTSEYRAVAQRPLNSELNCLKIKSDFGLMQPDWRVALHRTLSALRPVTPEG